MSEFETGQIVWAKLRTHPWWPAMVMDSIVKKGQHIVSVKFIEDAPQDPLRSTSLPAENIIHYDTGYVHFSTAIDKHTPSLGQSIQIADSLRSSSAFKKSTESCFQETEDLSLEDLREGLTEAISLYLRCRSADWDLLNGLFVRLARISPSVYDIKRSQILRR